MKLNRIIFLRQLLKVQIAPVRHVQLLQLLPCGYLSRLDTVQPQQPLRFPRMELWKLDKLLRILQQQYLRSGHCETEGQVERLKVKVGSPASGFPAIRVALPTRPQSRAIGRLRAEAVLQPTVTNWNEQRRVEMLCAVVDVGHCSLRRISKSPPHRHPASGTRIGGHKKAFQDKLNNLLESRFRQNTIKESNLSITVSYVASGNIRKFFFR